MIDGKLFTSFWWTDSVMKLVQYPVYTSSGTEVNRRFPIKPGAGEQTDHHHSIGYSN